MIRAQTNEEQKDNQNKIRDFFAKPKMKDEPSFTFTFQCYFLLTFGRFTLCSLSSHNNFVNMVI